MANIYDVARRARVSVATVSAVVNDSAYVSPHLKARVVAAIRELGYKPNLLARSLAKRQSHTLGVVVPDIANPFWPEVVRGIEDRAHAAGYTLLLSNSDDDPAKEAIYINLFLAKRVDGILLAKAPGRLARDLVAHLRSAGIPIVQLLRQSEDLHADAVLLDDREATYEGVAHLLRLGYRRIAFIAGPPHVTTARRRFAGYRQALKDWKVRFDPSLCYEGDFRVKSGYNGGLVILKRKPEAVFVSNYLMAVGFIKAMRQYQLRCPQDVAVVTCDDHPWMESFSPQLTTVNFPKYELGSEAARVLLERLKHPNRPVETLELKSALSIRESCGYYLKAATA
ncbi:MAG TPA: LacI family DNA-binding transcriptional regulator [Vicinamibacterales bacterium]|nr:LacI family DNA-binding transcriptional regulator [Vicinamibacterales bacterium]